MKYKVVASLMNISFEFFDFPLENSVYPIDLSEHFSAISLICIILYNLFNVLGPDRSILLKYIQRNDSGQESVYTCSMCGKSNAQKNNMMIHVESVHFPGMFVYSCKYCPKQLSTKKALYGHVNNYHK